MTNPFEVSCDCQHCREFECCVEGERVGTITLAEMTDDEVRTELEKLGLGETYRCGGGAGLIFDYERIL